MAILRWGRATDEGRLRSQNEDHDHAGEGLFVVADGMGGHLAGEIASEMAVAMLDERLPVSAHNTLDDLVTAINDANTKIYDDSVGNPDRAGMGTTVTAIAIVHDPHDGEAFAVANVGDSRGYVMRHGRLRQLTIDHSFVQELVAEGAITRAEARTHPRRNIVTRALGIEPYVRVDSWTMPIIRGDRFVLCSDGLVDEISDEAITDIINAHLDDPEAAARALVDAANEAGGRDNITVVVVDVVEGDDPPDPTQEFDVVPIWTDDAGGDPDATGETEIVSDPPDAPLADASTSLYDGGDDVAPVPGAAIPIVDGPAPEVVAAAAEVRRPRGRLAKLARFILAVGVAAVLVLGAVVFVAWARSGYYVAFNDDGEVVVYQGREGGVLWFDPTEEAVGPYSRDELDADSIEQVERRPEFESQASAEQYVSQRLFPAGPDDAPTEPDDGDTEPTSVSVAPTTEP